MDAQQLVSNRIDRMYLEIEEHKRAIESLEDRINIMFRHTTLACQMLRRSPNPKYAITEETIARCLRRHARKERRRASKIKHN